MAKSTNEPTYKKELSGTLGLKGDLNATRIHQYYKKRWLIVALIWVVTITVQVVTSFLITGWMGLILGIVLSAIPFFLGIWAITKVIEKDTYYNL